MLTFSWDPPLPDSQHTSKKMSNARIFAPLDKIFRTRLDKNCRSPIWEFSLEKAFLDAKSFFKYITFFIKILNLFTFKACFFLILSSFSLHFVSWHFCQTPPLADAMLTKFSNPPLSGVSWYVDDPLFGFKTLSLLWSFKGRVFAHREIVRFLSC